MSWPEIETFDEFMKRTRRKIAEKRAAKVEADKAKAQVKVVVEPVELFDRPPVRRSALPPQVERFPTDEELDRMWGKL